MSLTVRSTIKDSFCSRWLSRHMLHTIGDPSKTSLRNRHSMDFRTTHYTDQFSSKWE